jgi:hypothetical protein
VYLILRRITMNDKAKLKKFRLTYTVEYTKDVYATDEQTAVLDSIDTAGDDSWDGGKTSQIEGEEI